nr:DUF397 domain-containing protein [Streptomyces sp. NBC_00830]
MADPATALVRDSKDTQRPALTVPPAASSAITDHATDSQR